MNQREPGIIWRDGVHFCSVDNFTKDNLFYVLWGATYSLEKPYSVNRNYMDAFMLQYVKKGELNFIIRNKKITVKENELVLLSCQEKNIYWAEKPATVTWFHFQGLNVASLLEYIYQKNDNTGFFSGAYAKEISPLVDNILTEIKEKEPNVFQISRCIYEILCDLSISKTPTENPSNKIIHAAMNFMQNNYAKQLTVKDISDYVNLSPYHFSRLFAKYTYTAPHSYLLNIRLKAAKRLLIYTAENIESIALSTGFTSSSHFIRAFKKANNLTPYNFRKVFYSKK